MFPLPLHLPQLLLAGAEHGHPNFLAIPVGVVCAFILGGIWYSPALFAKAWQRRIGKTREELGSPVRPMVLNVIALGMMAIVLYVLEFEIPCDGVDGALLGLGLGLGLIAPALGIVYAYGSRGLVLWLIDAGYQVAALATIGAILGAWHG
jgi:hypothetical protein